MCKDSHTWTHTFFFPDSITWHLHRHLCVCLYVWVCMCVCRINSSAHTVLLNLMTASVFTLTHGLHTKNPITHTYTHTHWLHITKSNKISSCHISPLILFFLHPPQHSPVSPFFYPNYLLCHSLLTYNPILLSPRHHQTVTFSLPP